MKLQRVAAIGGTLALAVGLAACGTQAPQPSQSAQPIPTEQPVGGDVVWQQNVVAKQGVSTTADITNLDGGFYVAVFDTSNSKASPCVANATLITGGALTDIRGAKGASVGVIGFFAEPRERYQFRLFGQASTVCQAHLSVVAPGGQPKAGGAFMSLSLKNSWKSVAVTTPPIKSSVLKMTGFLDGCLDKTAALRITNPGGSLLYSTQVVTAKIPPTNLPVTPGAPTDLRLDSTGCTVGLDLAGTV